MTVDHSEDANQLPGMVPDKEENSLEAKRRWRQARASITADLPSTQIHRSAQGTSLARQVMTANRARRLKTAAAVDPSRRPKTANAMELRLMQEVNKRGLKADMDGDDDVDEIDRLKQIDVIREMPVSISWKRELRTKLYSMMPDYEESGCSAWLYRRKVKAYLAKRRGRKRWNEISQYLALWGSALNKIEGIQGSGVLTYFTFLRWLFALNLVIFVAVFFFVVIPQAVFPALNYNQWVIANTSSSVIDVVDTCSAIYVHNATVTVDAASAILGFVQGTGWMENTLMFCGYYVNKVVSISATYGYNIPLAYIYTMLFYLLFSLIMIVNKTSTGFRERLFTTTSASQRFCNVGFASWDYNVHKEDTADLRHKTCYQTIKGNLEERRRQQKLKNRTTEEKCKIYTIRFFVNSLVVLTLGGGAYLIYYTTEQTVKLTSSAAYSSYHTVVQFLIQYLSSIVISLLNGILPSIYKFLIRFEDYSTGFAVNMTLFRTVFLKLASLIILMISVFVNITCTPKDTCRVSTGTCSEVQCWETKIGQEIYKLVLTDFFIVVGLTFLVEFPRWLFVTKTSNKLSKKLGQKEFDIAKEVLGLIYGQTLLWLGTFYSPLLPAFVVPKIFLTFYMKYLTAILFYGPSTKAYSSSDSDAFFMYVLLIAYILCVIPIGYCVIMIAPSRGCGPFRLYDYVYDIINLNIATWPKGLVDFVTFIQSTIFELTAVVILLVIIYYLATVISAYKSMIVLLKEQLVMEGYDKKYLLEKIQELSADGPPKQALYKNNVKPKSAKPTTPEMVAPGVPIV